MFGDLDARALSFHPFRVGVVKKGMQKPDLVERLDTESKSLAAGQVTARMVRDWIDERLLEKSTSRGNRRGVPPTWTYSDETLQRGLRIVQLKAQGVHRASAFRINLWIDGFALPFRDVKLALKWEFGRMLSQLRREKSWSFDARYRRNIKAAELRKEGKRIAPVDIDLANAGFAPPLDVLLFSGSEAFWGSGERERFKARWRLSFRDSWPTPRRAQEFLLFLRPGCSEAKTKLRNRACPILRGLLSAI
jgi:hypothetical protein